MARKRTKLDLLRKVEDTILNSKEPLEAGAIADILKTNWVSVRDCCEYLREKGIVEGIEVSYKYSAPKSKSASQSFEESLIADKREPKALQIGKDT